MAVRGNYHFFNPMNEADDEVGWTSLHAMQALFGVPIKNFENGLSDRNTFNDAAAYKIGIFVDFTMDETAADHNGHFHHHNLYQVSASCIVDDLPVWLGPWVEEDDPPGHQSSPRSNFSLI